MERILTRATCAAIASCLITIASLMVIEFCFYVMAAGSVADPDRATFWSNARFHIFGSAADLSLLVRACLSGALASLLLGREERPAVIVIGCIYFALYPLYAMFVGILGGGNERIPVGWVAIMAVLGAVSALAVWLLRNQILNIEESRLA